MSPPRRPPVSIGAFDVVEFRNDSAPRDWAKLEVLVRYGSDWDVVNSKGISAASLMNR
jgi:hypothetical protein